MDVGAILLGGGITLAGTLVVQALVVPWVQGRTRRRERWENDVETFAAILDEELPRALDSFLSASLSKHYARQLQGQIGYDPVRVQELLQAYASEEREANQAVGQQMARLQVLERHLRRVHPEADYWDLLSTHRARLQVAVHGTYIGPPNDPGLDDSNLFENRWADVERQRKSLRGVLDRIDNGLEPPPRRRKVKIS